MYIVSVIDCGEERTFRASVLMMTEDELFFISKEVQYRFPPSNLIGIIHVSGRRALVTVGLENEERF